MPFNIRLHVSSLDDRYLNVINLPNGIFETVGYRNPSRKVSNTNGISPSVQPLPENRDSDATP